MPTVDCACRSWQGPEKNNEKKCVKLLIGDKVPVKNISRAEALPDILVREWLALCRGEMFLIREFVKHWIVLAGHDVHTSVVEAHVYL